MKPIQWKLIIDPSTNIESIITYYVATESNIRQELKDNFLLDSEVARFSRTKSNKIIMRIYKEIAQDLYYKCKIVAQPNI